MAQGQGQQSKPEGPNPRIPLVAVPTNRGSSTSFDSKLINAYIEKEADGEIWVVKRPGLVILSSGAVGAGHGVCNWLGDLYQVVVGVVYKNGVALTGSVDSTNGVYTFGATLGGTPSLFLQNGANMYYYNTTVGLTAVPSPPTFSPNNLVKGSAFLNGVMYVMDTGANIWGSNVNDLTTWNSLNLIKAQIEPDAGVCVAKQLVYVIALKQWSVEVFYDAGNATGSTLAPVQGSKINYGCRHAGTVQDMDGALYWVSATRAGSVGVMKMEALSATAISTPPIERILQSVDYSVVYSWAAKQDGHKFYGLSFPNSGVTLVFDDKMQEWYQWADPTVAYLSIVSSTFNSAQQVVLQDASDGNLYTLSNTAYGDAGTPFAVEVYTPNWDGGTKKGKTVNKLYVIGDQTVGSLVTVRTNDRDYNPQAWSNPVTVDLGLEAPYIDNMGTFKRRAHHVRHLANTPLRLKALEAHILVGSL